MPVSSESVAEGGGFCTRSRVVSVWRRGSEWRLEDVFGKCQVRALLVARRLIWVTDGHPQDAYNSRSRAISAGSLTGRFLRGAFSAMPWLPCRFRADAAGPLTERSRRHPYLQRWHPSLLRHALSATTAVHHPHNAPILPFAGGVLAILRILGAVSLTFARGRVRMQKFAFKSPVNAWVQGNATAEGCPGPKHRVSA